MASPYLRILKESARGLLSASDWQGHVATFHRSRCGSSVLGGLLNQHPSIHWDGEVFRGLYPNGFAKRFARKYPGLYLRQRRLRAGASFYGFEFKPYLHAGRIDVPFSEFLQQISSLGNNRYIRLTRQNSLRHFVSIAVGKKTRQWHISREERPELTRVRLDIEELLEHLRSMDEEVEELEDFLEGRPVLRLNYEDHIRSDPRIAYRRVCEFLGVRPAAVTIQHRRTNPFPLAEIVENFEEVEHTLSGTPYEWMLQPTERAPARSAPLGGGR